MDFTTWLGIKFYEYSSIFCIVFDYSGMIRHEDIDDGPIWSKPHKVCCVPCYIPCNMIFFPCRHAVSGSKQRYKKDGFDLDLAYITPRIIVHGFPATGLEHLYRNPRLEIRRFLDKYHFDNYKTFNFCCEPGRGYNPSVFYGRVERYPFKDHHIPPLETMAAFAQSAKAWLDANPSHVVNMHCKAGKGRAGVMCCVLMIRNGDASSALDAMAQYDEKRVTNRKGLTLTSQRKSVIFYEYLWRYCWGVTGNIGKISAKQAAEKAFKVPTQPSLPLVQIEILLLPNLFLQRHVHQYRIKVHKVTNFRPVLIYDSSRKKNSNLEELPSASSGLFRQNIISVDCSTTILQGNFKITVFVAGKSAFGSLKWMKLLELQHNTYFMPRKNTITDFGLDQMDMKKSMKRLLLAEARKEGLVDTKVDEQLVLRLKFNLDRAEMTDEDALVFGDDFGADDHPANSYMRLAIADDDDDEALEDAEETKEMEDVAVSNALSPPIADLSVQTGSISVEPITSTEQPAVEVELVPVSTPSLPSESETQETNDHIAEKNEGLEVTHTGVEEHDTTQDTTHKTHKKRMSLSNPIFKMVGRAKKKLFGKKKKNVLESEEEHAEPMIHGTEENPAEVKDEEEEKAEHDEEEAKSEIHPSSLSANSSHNELSTMSPEHTEATFEANEETQETETRHSLVENALEFVTQVLSFGHQNTAQAASDSQDTTEDVSGATERDTHKHPVPVEAADVSIGVSQETNATPSTESQVNNPPLTTPTPTETPSSSVTTAKNDKPNASSSTANTAIGNLLKKFKKKKQT